MAHLYSAQPTDRIPPQSRRHPFTNSVNTKHRLPPSPPPPAKPQKQEEEKKPASPPLPRQNAKITPPSPPKVICDKSGRYQLNRVGFLGEGGFARVYEVKSPTGRLACKVVTKSSLKTKKAKTKLYAEIKIHRSLEHPNIVRFEDCFEDDENVYMTLELCPSGSLMDLLRRRRRFTEPEVRFFMVQLAGACHYMHIHQVIHRDLKLGNLFLDANMNLKVGDFGLAALIENPGERKKTVCGTPNYIAPEVLFDTANGHSFEVDTWSIGVILYTLLIGRPPFQTSEVKAIYQRIRDNVYDFPPERATSSNAQHLITQILTPDPQLRPSLHEIVDHPFFTYGPVPSYIPTSAHDVPPDFRNISRAASQANLRRLRRYALLDEDQVTSIAVPRPVSTEPPASSNQSTASMISSSKNMTTSIAQQEKEFQRAVQPGSPISALLSSARQPLMMASANVAATGAGKDTLLRKLQTAKDSPLGKKSIVRGPDGMLEERERGEVQREIGGRMAREQQGAQEEELRVRKKELEAQKARIVAQMAPVREEEEQMEEDMMSEDEKPPARQRDVKMKVQEQENVPPSSATTSSAGTLARGKETEKRISASRAVRPQQQVPVQAPPTKAVSPVPPQAQPQLSAFDAAAHVLSLAFEAKEKGRLFRDPRENPHLPLPEERVFIVSWVDYCNKYGMGYALTDGSVGVHFNDSTSIVLSADKQHFDYISSRKHGVAFVRKSYAVDTYPEELKSKVYLLKHFERYIMDRLYGDYEYTFEDVGRRSGMEWVQKYLRMKHVIVFKLSHDVLQFNFYDHSKVILSSHGLVITHIDKNYKMTRWLLSDVMALALQPPSALADLDPDVVKFNQKLVDKLKYCKEVLVSIRTASAQGTPVPEETEAPVAPVNGGGLTVPSMSGAAGLTNKMSRTSLR